RDIELARRPLETQGTGSRFENKQGMGRGHKTAKLGHEAGLYQMRSFPSTGSLLHGLFKDEADAMLRQYAEQAFSRLFQLALKSRLRLRLARVQVSVLMRT
ncbi:hypothetical protein ACWGS9_31640, partial [Bradyrhizobium sp. Arg314]